MKRIIPYTAINVALLSFAFGQSAIAQESGSGTSEQEVRQAIEKYRTALLAARLNQRLAFTNANT